MEELIKFLQSIYPLSPGLETHLRSIIRKKTFRKGDILLHIGETCNEIFYLRTGLIRSFYMLDEKEVSNWFMKEGDICISVISFVRRTPSLEGIMALEDGEYWGITHAELEEGIKLFIVLALYGMRISNEYYCQCEERLQALRRQPPAVKYAHLIEASPDLVNRVQIKHLASYLNVSTRTFNLIRKAYKEEMELRRRRERGG